MNEIQTLAVVGAGTMGLGIAQLGVQHGLPTVLFDLNPAALEKAQAAIAAGLGKLVAKNKLTAEAREAALARLTLTTELADVRLRFDTRAAIEDVALDLHKGVATRLKQAGRIEMHAWSNGA